MEYDNSGVRRQDRLLSEENALHAAFRMPSYHDFIHAEFIDRDSSYFIEESKGLVITPPAFLMLLTSPLRIPGGAGKSSTRRVSVHVTMAIFLSGYWKSGIAHIHFLPQTLYCTVKSPQSYWSG